MCGIVGYIGEKQAFPILIEGLKKLEYRGYDSAGVALVKDQGELNVYKTTGKVANLETLVDGKDIEGHVGIAHTRWATHGEPSVKNAHPHVSMDGNIAIVHNGIIENYQVLKQQLVDRGYMFNSTTDTEVLCQLIDYYYNNNGSNLLSAVCSALNDVIGAYAIVVTEKKNPHHLVAARQSSPLVVGVGKDKKEFFIASDATPIVEHTDKVVYLDDGQIADISINNGLHIVNHSNKQCQFDIKTVDMDISKLSKGGFDHFMLKEIYEQPNCLRDAMSGRLIANAEHPENNRIVLSALRDYRDRLVNARNIIILGCGTSWHAGLIGKQLIESMCRKRVNVEYASEFRYNNPVVDKDDVVIAISQSGETADTLAAIQLAKQHGALIFGIVNAVGSSIARETDTGIYLHVGPEIGVASTKAFTGQVAMLTLFALALGHETGTLSDNEYHKIIGELALIPTKMEKELEVTEKIANLAKMFTYAHNFLYLGRGFNYPVALEGALKLKEISYIHAEGYPAAEMKHGPIALVDQDMPIVFIATHHKLYEKIISNMQEVKSRKGRILANVAVDKGLNVDMPRNLAKSVTVE